MDWSQRTSEDRMLFQYWQQIGGRVYTEVPIAGPQGDTSWSAASTTRRLDAVRFSGRYGEQGIFPFSRNASGFMSDVRTELAWLIEVKPKINRTAIGQVIAGTDLFQKQYGVAPAKLVIVCASGDAALGRRGRRF